MLRDGFSWVAICGLLFVVGASQPTSAFAQHSPKSPNRHDAQSQGALGPAGTGNIVHGTINVVFANGNGIVALTDSMATITGSDGQERQSPSPNQKLFVIDDSTVCTIAGFASQDFQPFSGATTDIQSLIYTFARNLKGQSKVPLEFKLRGLESMIKVHLQVLAASASIGHGSESSRARNYEFELIMAGYDQDGSAHLGSFHLAASPNPRRANGYYEVELRQYSVEKLDSTIKYLVGGQSKIADAILNGLTTAHEPSISNYQLAKAKDSGASLTTEEMKELAIFIAAQTARTSRSVGGENQIAVLKPSVPIELTQRHFAEPSGDVEPIGLVIDVRMKNFSSGAIISPYRTMYIASSFEDSQQDLDQNYFVGDTFVHCRLIYGERLLGLDTTNTVIGSQLFIRRTVDRHSTQLRDLLQSFAWSDVIYEDGSSAGTGPASTAVPSPVPH
jgi:20S proteasome alpha/beta subunit